MTICIDQSGHVSANENATPQGDIAVKTDCVSDAAQSPPAPHSRSPKRLRTMTSFALACLLLLPGLPSVAHSANLPDSRSAIEDCSADSQAGMHDCLEKKARDSERKLKKAEDATFSTIGKWDEDAKYIAAARDKLKYANREYIQYRNAHCALAASLGGGAIGNALDMLRLACNVELNTLRAEQLSRAVIGLPRR